jgi:hypothetical protein
VIVRLGQQWAHASILTKRIEIARLQMSEPEKVLALVIKIWAMLVWFDAVTGF